MISFLPGLKKYCDETQHQRIPNPQRKNYRILMDAMSELDVLAAWLHFFLFVCKMTPVFFTHSLPVWCTSGSLFVRWTCHASFRTPVMFYEGLSYFFFGEKDQSILMTWELGKPSNKSTLDWALELPSSKEPRSDRKDQEQKFLSEARCSDRILYALTCLRPNLFSKNPKMCNIFLKYGFTLEGLNYSRIITIQANASRRQYKDLLDDHMVVTLVVRCRISLNLLGSIPDMAQLFRLRRF